MANAVFEYLCGDSFHASILAEDIPDLTLRFIVEQVCSIIIVDSHCKRECVFS